MGLIMLLFFIGMEASPGSLLSRWRLAIFGVTAHIRKVADEFAARGFLVLAPALFDRLKPGADLAYTQIDVARTLMQQVNIDDVATDLSASIAALRGLLLPPGTRARSQGLLVGKKAEISQDDPIPNSSRFPLPSSTAPASSNLVTAVAS